MRSKAVVTVLVLGLLPACTTTGDVVRKRAAIERQCPEASIQITELPGSAYRADGCGRSETFVCTVAQSGGASCIKEGGGVAVPGPGPRP